MSRQPAAILFDFDGVIVDSERLHHRTMVEVAEGLIPAFDWAFYCEHLMGMDDRGAFAYLLEWAGREASAEAVRHMVDAKAVRFAALAAAGDVPAFSGAADFVRACAARWPTGLCTGALRSDILPNLRHIGLEDAFAEMVTADDVALSKPAPDTDRVCVEKRAARFPEAGIAPETSVTFEDTPEGIASACGAGVAVIGVTTLFTAEQLVEAGAVRTVPGLGGLSPDVLADVLPD